MRLKQSPEMGTDEGFRFLLVIPDSGFSLGDDNSADFPIGPPRNNKRDLIRVLSYNVTEKVTKDLALSRARHATPRRVSRCSDRSNSFIIITRRRVGGEN
jgi:hypothetical protein